MVPVYWLTDNLDLALRADLALLVVADTLTAVLLAWVAYRVAGRVAAVVAAAIWAVSPIALGMALGGLETSLAMMCEIGLVAVWIWANDAPNARRWVAVGAAGALAVLARVDAIALFGLLALVQVWRGGWRRMAPAAAASVWCWHRGGSGAGGTSARRFPRADRRLTRARRRCTVRDADLRRRRRGGRRRALHAVERPPQCAGRRCRARARSVRRHGGDAPGARSSLVAPRPGEATARRPFPRQLAGRCRSSRPCCSGSTSGSR